MSPPDLRPPTFPLVLAGPSGSGKTTVGRALERRGLVRFGVSATTRPRRPEEDEGVDYHFLPRDEFEAGIREDRFLEWAEVHGHLYGTPHAALERARSEGRHLLLDIDVQGARSVRRQVPGTVSVFLVPPTGDRIVARLLARGSEGPGELRRRLRTAEDELRAVGEFGYLVVNDVLEEAVDALECILRAEELRTVRMGVRVEREVSDLIEEIRRAVDDELGDGSESPES